MAVATGQRTWLGIGKQPNFQTKVAPAIFHGMDTFSPVSKWGWIDRPETRQVQGRVLAAQGPYSMTAALKAAPDPGAVEQLIAYAMGTQSAPAPAQMFLTATTAASAVGSAVTVPITPNTGAPTIAAGQSLVWDAGGANQETITVTSATASSVTATFTKTHPTNAQIAVQGVTAMGSNLTFGVLKELPYFTYEHYRDTDCYDYIGNAIDTMKISVDMGGKLVGFEFGIVGNASVPAVNASPATPAFVTTQPFTSETALATYTGGAGAQLLGSAGVVPLQSASISLNNQLDKAYRTVGSQYPVSFPLGQRKVSATIKTGFENNQEFIDFINQGTCALSIKLSSTTVIETVQTSIAIPYQMTITMPTCRIMQDVISQKTSGPLDQTLSLEGYASAIGANNDLSISVINTASAVY